MEQREKNGGGEPRKSEQGERRETKKDAAQAGPSAPTDLGHGSEGPALRDAYAVRWCFGEEDPLVQRLVFLSKEDAESWETLLRSLQGLLVSLFKQDAERCNTLLRGLLAFLSEEDAESCNALLRGLLAGDDSRVFALTEEVKVVVLNGSYYEPAAPVGPEGLSYIA